MITDMVPTDIDCGYIISPLQNGWKTLQIRINMVEGLGLNG